MGLMTIDDLAQRWGISTVDAWELVRVGSVPFIWLGRGEPDLTRRGRKPIRFRLADVDAWETSRRRAWETPEPQRRRVAFEPVVTIAGTTIGGRLKLGSTDRKRKHS